MKSVSVLFGILSILVVWSECTFWVKKPTLSIFALIVRNASETHNYFNLEVFCIFIISYLCFCAYSTLFQIKVSYYILLKSNSIWFLSQMKLFLAHMCIEGAILDYG